MAQQSGAGGLEEIVVTAEKRSSTVQETPISITAISGDQLQAQGTSSVEALALETPGLSMRSAGPGQTEFEARGLSSSGGSSPTVGFYLDETPLTPPAAAMNGKVVIDPDLYDLNRVEVLRGPQGTLYGSGSMGGTIKLVTNQPKLGQLEGSVDGIVSGTDGGGANGGGSVMLNIPAGDKVAIRLVGTEKYTSGWIDRVVLDPFPYPTNPCSSFTGVGCTRGNVLAAHVSQVIPDVNSSELTGARAGLLLKPTDDLTVDLTVLYQRTTAGGYNEFQSPPGADAGLAIYQPFNVKEPFSDTFKLYSGVVDYDLGFATLTYASSAWSREEKQTQDSTEAVQNLFVVPTYLALPFTENDYSRQISQELRLASPAAAPWQWVGGIFFSDLHSTWVEINQSPAYAFLSAPGTNPAGIIYNADNPYHIQQYALFGDGNYQLTDELKLTLGLRYFHYRTAVDFIQNGLGTATGDATPTAGHVSSSADGFNPRFNLSYAPDANLTVYATASKGFRPGGVNLPVPLSGGTSCLPGLLAEGLHNVPLSYGPDSVWNYELGEKARLLDNRVTVNADFYFNKWTGVQQYLVLPCGYPYTANAGNADTFGPELEVAARLTSELRLVLEGTYTEATLTKAYPTTGLSGGLPILNIPNYTGSVTLGYNHALTDDYNLVVSATDEYVGPATDLAFSFVNLPAYDLVGLRAGIETERWSAYLFGNNLTDKHAWLTTNNTGLAWTVPTITRVTTNQPRTIGLDMQYKF